FDDRDDVPEAQSLASTTPTLRPRVAASKADPAPVTPPPTMKTSRGSSALVFFSVSIACSRKLGDSSPFRIVKSALSRGRALADLPRSTVAGPARCSPVPMRPTVKNSQALMKLRTERQFRLASVERGDRFHAHRRGLLGRIEQVEFAHADA